MDISQESLTLATTWMIGEYGDILVESGVTTEEQSKPVCFQGFYSCSRETEQSKIQVTDSDVVDILESILNSPYINTLLKQFILTALIKLIGRPTTGPAQQQRILRLLESFNSSQELEIQQRSVEYITLVSQHGIAAGVLERMPPPELKATVIGTGKAFH
jgi:AP-1 complex subunit gamma-1